MIYKCKKCGLKTVEDKPIKFCQCCGYSVIPEEMNTQLVTVDSNHEKKYPEAVSIILSVLALLLTGIPFINTAVSITAVLMTDKNYKSSHNAAYFVLTLIDSAIAVISVFWTVVWLIAMILEIF